MPGISKKNQKQKTAALVSVFEKMTDADQEFLQKSADALHAKNPRKQIALKLMLGGLCATNIKTG